MVIGDIAELNGVTLSIFWVAEVVRMIHEKGRTVTYNSPTPHASFTSTARLDIRDLCSRLSFGEGMITLVPLPTEATVVPPESRTWMLR